MAAVGEITITRESFLGRGGFGEVYRGSWSQNGDQLPAAIKSIQHTNSEEEFQREINLLRQMDHLFVVKFLGSTIVDSVKYIGLELCEGTLNQYVHGQLKKIPKGTFEEKYLAGQITFALSYLHSKRIIHKDLKPDNVLLWQSSTGLTLAKLADFGFSRQLPFDRTTFDDTTHLGTSGYIAPELRPTEEGERTPSFASDIWSLGIVLFFIVSDGQHPYGERLPQAEDFDIRDHLIEEMKVPPNVQDVETEKWDAADLILHMIDPNPENRPNITDVLIHPYFSLTNKGTRKQFLSYVHNIFRGVGHKSLREFYSQSAMQNWYDSLDPKLRRKDIEEDLENIQPILKNLKHSGNSFAEQMEKMFSTHESSLMGQQRKQVIDGEKNTISELDVLTTYSLRYEVLIKLLEAGPRLIATYTWSQLQSKEQREEPELRMDDVSYSMLFLAPDTFQEVVQMKLKTLKQPEKQIQLDNWFNFACGFDLPDIAMTLVCCGADIQSRKPGGGTALHLAIITKGSLQLVENLLEVGADPSAADDNGFTPLHCVAMNSDDVEVIELVLNSCLKIDTNCRNWPTRILGVTARQLVSINPSPNVIPFFQDSESIGQMTIFGFDAVIFAVLARDATKLEYLISKGGDVNTRAEDGMTPLHFICFFDGTSDIVEVLLRAGADPNIQDAAGKTALHCAVFGANIEVAKILLTNDHKKADPNLKMNDGRTCLHIVTSGHLMNMDDCYSVIDHSKFQNVLRNLAQQGRLLNAEAFEENVTTPFFNELTNVAAPACTFGDRHTEMIEILWDAGADLHNRDNEGNTPLHCIAANSPNVETTELLLALDADTQARDHEGYLPLHCAAHENPNPEVTQALWFATFDSKDSRDDKQTAAELATENENSEVLNLIICLMGQ